MNKLEELKKELFIEKNDIIKNINNLSMENRYKKLTTLSCKLKVVDNFYVNFEKNKIINEYGFIDISIIDCINYKKNIKFINFSYSIENLFSDKSVSNVSTKMEVDMSYEKIKDLYNEDKCNNYISNLRNKLYDFAINNSFNDIISFINYMEKNNYPNVIVTIPKLH